MGQIGYCYGSEYHLLRYLGHHRIWLNQEIGKQTRFKNDIKWFDYLVNNSKLSMDDEYNNIQFLKDRIDFALIESNWKNYWPQKGNTQNWDGIFYHNDEIVLIEAKAHITEMQQSCEAKEGSGKNKISESLSSTREYFGIQATNDWLKKYYQLANRLAFINFLDHNYIKASLLNIYFINGYQKRVIEKRGSKEQIIVKEDKSVLSKDQWQSEIDREYEYLGIENSSAKNRIESVFIDCIGKS
jgi:hypothetical protein